MSSRRAHMLVWLLCFAVSGAAHAALCRANRPADPHACCHRDRPGVPATPGDPCQRCTIVPATPATPKAPAAVTFDLAPVVEIPTHTDRETSITHPAAAADDRPIPPLLLDLHHLSCQLTE